MKAKSARAAISWYLFLMLGWRASSTLCIFWRYMLFYQTPPIFTHFILFRLSLGFRYFDRFINSTFVACRVANEREWVSALPCGLKRKEPCPVNKQQHTSTETLHFPHALNITTCRNSVTIEQQHRLLWLMSRACFRSADR